jgi:predicted transposase/invertase (TIGR01784 family)
LLELPKYAPFDDNAVIADPRDQWMYFFRRAEGSTVEELLDRLPDPVFKQAVGVLEMISRTPDQRRHYDARLKWELDENTRIQSAFEEGEIKGREEGESKGREEGELFGKIRMLQNLLSLPQSIDQELQPKSRTELETLATELQAQLRKRMT